MHFVGFGGAKRIAPPGG